MTLWVKSLVFKACNNAFFRPLVPSPLCPYHGILSLVVVAVSILFRLKSSIILVVFNIIGASFHHIILPMLHILMGRLNTFLVGCIRNESFSLTTFVDIIGGRRVIEEMNITLCKGKLMPMITRPFVPLLRFWDRTFKAFSCLFIKYNITSRAEHYLRILQVASIEEVNQFFFCYWIGCLQLLVELRLWNNLFDVFHIFSDVHHLAFFNINFCSYFRFDR
jgi:hypothetical protein